MSIEREAMNRKQIIILICALIVSGVILWRNLPLPFPGTILVLFLLCVKLFIVVFLTAVALVLTGGKKKPS
jgi:hypothetical protein